jgi:uncharacterized repeat protein (TIGR02543 family)
MNRHPYFVGLAASTVLFAACSLSVDFGKATGSIQVYASSSVPGARTILPTAVDVVRYQARGTGPGSSSIPDTDSTSGVFSFLNLDSGVWTITVDGFDTNGDLLASGSASVTVTAGSSSHATIRLSPIGGNGALSLVVSGLSGRSVTAVVGTITSSGGSASAISLTISGDTAAYANAALAADSYSLLLRVMNGATQIAAPLADTVLIYAGHTSTGTFALTNSSFDFYVRYNANGATSGTPPTDATARAYGDSVTVLGNTGSLARTGYNFVGWNTAADGSGTAYAPGATIPSVTGDVALYAAWSPNGSGGIDVVDPPIVTVALSGQTSTLAPGASMTVTATPSPAASGDAYSWYVDGALLSGQSSASCTFGSSLAVGAHSVMAVVAREGFLFSATHYFRVR